LFDVTSGGEVMKYVLLFCGTDEDAAAFAALSPEQLRARYAGVGAWFAQHRLKIGSTNQLQGPETATSVRFGADGPAVVTDGPFLEGKEAMAGTQRSTLPIWTRHYEWQGHGREEERSRSVQ
jgi:hypothetical protein